ncbi:MAG: GatB/YqeY domain-containing protein, partial [Pseudomonadota bacterium]
MLRTRLQKSLKEAMKAGDKPRLGTLRLITAAIKDRDIAVRGEDGVEGVSEDEILAILTKMIRQRQESASTYEEAARLDLAAREREEIAVIEEFLPKPLAPAEVKQAIAAAIAETEAGSIRDMGRVMAALKARYPGRMDFAKASA